jgi:hypothetical protein
MPNEVSWFNEALTCMRGTGLAEARKASVILLLSGYVRNLTTMEADIMAAMMASGQTPLEWMGCWAGVIRDVADRDRFPALATFMDARVFEADDGPDDEFIFGLERILDGIEALIGREGCRSITAISDAGDIAVD